MTLYPIAEHLAANYLKNSYSLISFASWIIACTHTWQGDLKQAIEYAERSVEKAPTPGDQVWGQAILAWALNRTGETEKGIAIIAGQSCLWPGPIACWVRLPQITSRNRQYPISNKAPLHSKR